MEDIDCLSHLHCIDRPIGICIMSCNNLQNARADTLERLGRRVHPAALGEIQGAAYGTLCASGKFFELFPAISNPNDLPQWFLIQTIPLIMYIFAYIGK